MKYTDICRIVTNVMLINKLIRLDNEQVSMFNRDFKRKIFAGVGFDPLTIRPTSSVTADCTLITVVSAIFGFAQLAPTWLPLVSRGLSPRRKSNKRLLM